MTITEFKARVTSRIVWGNCLGMVVASVLLLIVALVGLRYYTHHGENIAVPDLRGLSAQEADAKLRGLGLELMVADSGYVRTMAADAVLAQQITPGTEVKVGRVVRVTINSTDSPTIAMPDLADNCSLHEARARLRAMGFTLGRIEYTTGEHDWVYAVKVGGRTVTAGMRVAYDKPVVLVVGDGSSDMEDDFMGFDDGMGEDSIGDSYDF